MGFPGMVSNIDMSLKAYLQARRRVDIALESFDSLCKSFGTNHIVLSQNIEPFASVREAISWAISLYDQINKSVLNDDIRRFMSAIKFIDNTLKHSADKFWLYSFCRPGINMSVEVDDSESGPVYKSVFFHRA